MSDVESPPTCAAPVGAAPVGAQASAPGPNRLKVSLSILAILVLFTMMNIKDEISWTATTSQAATTQSPTHGFSAASSSPSPPPTQSCVALQVTGCTGTAAHAAISTTYIPHSTPLSNGKESWLSTTLTTWPSAVGSEQTPLSLYYESANEMWAFGPSIGATANVQAFGGGGAHNTGTTPFEGTDEGAHTEEYHCSNDGDFVVRPLTFTCTEFSQKTEVLAPDTTAPPAATTPPAATPPPPPATTLPASSPNGPGPDSPCGFPTPLYPPRAVAFETTIDDFPALVESFTQVKDWFADHSFNAFAYLDSGGVLGLYRDGSLIPGDSDVDLRVGKCGGDYAGCGPQCSMDAPCHWPSHGSLLSFNDYMLWGDPYTRRDVGLNRGPTSKALVDDVRKNLCLTEVLPGVTFWTHNKEMALRSLEFLYTHAWFVRMPFKGPDKPWVWYDYAKAGPGHNGVANDRGFWKCIAICKEIDANKNKEITIEELRARVVADGIDETQFDLQISVVKQCKAAKFLTYLMNFPDHPEHIEYPDLPSWKTAPRVESKCADDPRWAFPECDLLA